jgi:hypothetical protein
MRDEIGNAAGVVWGVLDREGELTLTALKDRSGLSDQMVSMALGWLAREGKLTFLKEGRATRVSLVDS